MPRPAPNPVRMAVIEFLSDGKPRKFAQILNAVKGLIRPEVAVRSAYRLRNYNWKDGRVHGKKQETLHLEIRAGRARELSVLLSAMSQAGQVKRAREGWVRLKAVAVAGRAGLGPSANGTRPQSCGNSDPVRPATAMKGRA